MSQEKVDRYKEQKAHRQEIYKKEKRILALEKAAGVLVCAAVVAWIGYSVYGKVTAIQDAKVIETVMDATAIDEYLTEMNAAE